MDLAGVRQINEEVEKEALFLNELLAEVRKTIVGQGVLIERVLVGLLADGHILLEGVPGLAKTLLVKTISQAINARFSRLQFTPDLLPADLIGTQIYNPGTSEFSVHKGPIFANLILADEVNRAPAKVQSALLEAMQERQITIGGNTFPLESLFLVLATQNPIEQEGTYPLPEAQVDRFMLKVLVDYPSRQEERSIIDRMTGEELPPARPVIEQGRLLHARKGHPANLRRRQNQGIRARSCGRHSRRERAWSQRSAPPHRLRRVTPGEHLSNCRRARPCVSPWPWLRYSRGHQGNGTRYPPASRHNDLRGGGGGDHQRRYRAANSQPHRRALRC